MAVVVFFPELWLDIKGESRKEGVREVKFVISEKIRKTYALYAWQTHNFEP